MPNTLLKISNRNFIIKRNFFQIYTICFYEIYANPNCINTMDALITNPSKTDATIFRDAGVGRGNGKKCCEYYNQFQLIQLKQIILRQYIRIIMKMICYMINVMECQQQTIFHLILFKYVFLIIKYIIHHWHLDLYNPPAFTGFNEYCQENITLVNNFAECIGGPASLGNVKFHRNLGKTLKYIT